MRINGIYRRAGIFVGALILIAMAACGGGGDATSTSTPMPTPEPGVTPGPGVTDDEIRLGMTNDLSGAGGTPYAAVTTAVEAYFAFVNEEHDGVCGRELVLLAEDDEYTPEIALEKVTGLVLEGEVLAMIGGQSTEIHLPVARTLNENSIPDLFVSSGWSGWGDVQQFPWTFGLIPDYASDGEVIATYINREHRGEDVAVLYEDSAFGRDYLSAIRQAISDRALIAAEVAYQPPDASLSGETPAPAEDGEGGEQTDDGEGEGQEFDPGGLVDALVESGAEVVVLASTPDVTAKVFQAADEVDFNPQFILSYVNTPSTVAATIGGGTSADDLLSGFQALSGTVTTEYLVSLIEDEGLPALVEHERVMSTYNGPTTTTLSIYGQTLGETIVEALSLACSTLTREGVRDAAESLSGFSPSLLRPGIEINLGPEDHRAIESLQPVRIEADGVLTPAGDPISAEG